MASGWVRCDVGDVDAELEAGSAPWDPHDAVAEALLGQRLPVRRGGEGDAGVGVEVVDVRRLDEGVHRRVDRRRSSPGPCRQKSNAATISSSRSTPG